MYFYQINISIISWGFLLSHTENLDVTFVVDISSHGISRENFDNAKKFLQNVTERLSIQSGFVRVAVILMDFDVTTEIKLNSFLNESSEYGIQNDSSVYAAIRGMEHSNEVRRRGFKLPEILRADIWKKNGDRPNTKNVLIFLTKRIITGKRKWVSNAIKIDYGFSFMAAKLPGTPELLGNGGRNDYSSMVSGPIKGRQNPILNMTDWQYYEEYASELVDNIYYYMFGVEKPTGT